MKRLVANYTPRCIDCENGSFSHFPGSMYEPPSDEFECEFDWEGLPDDVMIALKITDEDIDDIMDKAYDRDATNCPGFKPIILGNCSNCGKSINEPSYQHPQALFVSNGYEDNLPVCSEECKKEMKEKVDNHLKEDDAIIEEYNQKRKSRLVKTVEEDDHI